MAHILVSLLSFRSCSYSRRQRAVTSRRSSTLSLSSSRHRSAPVDQFRRGILRLRIKGKESRDTRLSQKDREENSPAGKIRVRDLRERSTGFSSLLPKKRSSTKSIEVLRKTESCLRFPGRIRGSDNFS